ncbi:hypothetical protein D3C76_817470 [compost metagenome]
MIQNESAYSGSSYTTEQTAFEKGKWLSITGVIQNQCTMRPRKTFFPIIGITSNPFDSTHVNVSTNEGWHGYNALGWVAEP